MEKFTGDEPAMPFLKHNEDGYGQSIVLSSSDGSKQFLNYETGLTIRQQFAAMAMQGLMAVNNKGEQGWDEGVISAAKISVQMADALITALNQ